MDFRPRIKDLCQIKGMTQKDLAEKLGITDISLNKTLRGEYPQLQTLEKIAIALGVPITDLFGTVQNGDLVGFIKINGNTYEINSVEDIRILLQKIETNSI